VSRKSEFAPPRGSGPESAATAVSRRHCRLQMGFRRCRGRNLLPVAAS